MSRLLETEAGAVDYVESGASNGPGVLFLRHGFSTRFSVANLADNLKRRLPCRRPFLFLRPGCRKSPPLVPVKPVGYLMREAVVVLPAVIYASAQLG